MKQLYTAVILLLLVTTAQSQNKYYRAFVVDHNKVPNTTQTNFPVLISGTYPFLKTVANGGKVSNSNGYDILFTTDSTGTTKLNWEVERYNPATGELVAWVKANLSPATDTRIYIQYGDPAISTFQGNISATWNSSYAAVYHLKNGTTLSAADATSNANNGTIVGATATSGQIEGAASLSGAPQYINAGNGASIGLTGNMTIEAWVNPTDYSNYSGIAGKTSGTYGFPKPFDFYLTQNTGIPQLYRGNGTMGNYSNVAGTAAPATGVWSHIVVTISGNTVTHYLNGVVNGSGTLSAAGAGANGTESLFIGSRNDFATRFKGKMDEVRLLNAALSADWVRTSYNNQSSPSTFYTISNEGVVGNASPVANAGSNQTIKLPVSSASLAGSGSDADGTISTYTWAQVSGPSTAGISAATSANTNVTGLIEGVYTFSLTVTDNFGASSNPATVTVTVDPQNFKPIANAGGNQTVILPASTANLSGSGSDPDGTVTAYAWSQVSGPSTAGISSPGSQNTGVTGLVAGLYVFRLTVTDNAGATGTADVNVMVNSAPAKFNYRAITIDRTKIPNTAQTNFPVLISGIYPFLKTTVNGGKVNNSNGYDIIFALDTLGTNRLSWEIEKYVPATGELIAWVKTDVSPAADKVIYMQYGDVSITTFQGNVAGTWNSSFATVHHLKDGVALTPTDATVNANNGTVSGATATNGKIDGAAALNGSSHINIGNGASLGITGTMTIEAWVNPSDYSTYGAIIGKTSGPYPKPFDFYLNQGTGIPQLYRGSGSMSGYAAVPASAAPPAGTWSHLVVTISGSTVTHYLNGVVNGTGTLGSAGAAQNGSDNVYIGTRSDFGTRFKGSLDEVRLLNTALSADWIRAEYNNQSSPSTFYAMGVEKTVPLLVNAGADRTLILPVSSVTLQGSGSTPNTFTSTSWTRLSGPNNPVIVSPSNDTTQVTGLIEGVYTFRLTKTDNAGGVGSDDVVITVEPYNNPPVVTVGVDQTIILPATTTNLTGSATDSDGSIASYSWTTFSGPNTPVLATPAAANTAVSGLVAGTYVFRFIATDNRGAKDTADVTVIVRAGSILDPNDPVITYNGSNTPTQMFPNTLYKWVRTVRLGWNTDSYKCYIYNNIPFRLKFPKTYNPTANDGKKYPMIIFFHGLGEKGPNTDNEYQLYHGGDVFRSKVDDGTFDGYVLSMQSEGFWGGGHYAYLKDIIDYMIINNKLDPFQVVDNGLSAGGQGTWEMFLTYPTYIAASLPMSSCQVGYMQSPSREIVKYMPVWNFNGGADYNPAPPTCDAVRDAIIAAGGSNYKNTLYPELGHDTWNRAWSEPDFFPFVNRAYKSNPITMFGRTEFCPGDPINITIGLTSGFDQYEWRKNGVLISGATGPELNVTAIGTYDARVRRGSYWSEWSRIPVVVKIKTPTVPPTITVSGLMSKVIPAVDTARVTIKVPGQYASYVWQRSGNPTSIGTDSTLSVVTPGDYVIQVTEQYGCASSLSAPFTVIDANGPNKPSAAGSPIVSVLSKTSLRLDWSDNPSPQFNETGYEIYQSGQSGTGYKLIAITGANVATYTISNLHPNTRYYYKIRAVNNTAASDVSEEVSGITDTDVQPPSAPANLVISARSINSVTLSWSPSTDDVEVTGYEVYIDGQKAYTTTGTTYYIYPLDNKRSYTFYVKAKDFAGNRSTPSNQVSGQAYITGLNYKFYTGSWDVLPNFATLTPAATGMMPNVALQPRSQDDQFGFLWEGFIRIPVAGTYTFQTSSDDGSKLYLGALNGGGSPYSHAGSAIVNNDGLHGTVSVNSVDMTLSAGVYPIAATFFEQGGGEVMNVAWKTPQTGGNFVTIPDSVFTDAPASNGTAPAAPSNLVATAASFKQVNLAWIDNSANETGFELWRSTNSATGFTIVGTAASNATSFVDSLQLAAATTYYYKIRAIGQYGESALIDNLNFTEALWKLNNNYNDSTGNGRTLTATGTPSFDASSKMEGTHSLSIVNGTSRYLTPPASSTFLQNSYTQKTIAFWMRSSTNTGNRIVADIGGSDNGISIVLNSSTLYAAVASGSVMRSLSDPYTSTGWNHIAVVYSGSSLRLYVNGVQEAVTTALPFSSVGSTSNGSRIAYSNGTHAYNTSSPGYFNGWMDNFAIYNKALTATEVLNLVSNQQPGQSFATTAVAPALPAVPTGLLASAGTVGNSVAVTWTDNATNETGYELYRSNNDNTHYLLLKTLPANTASYTDTALFAHAIYYYKVRATGVGGKSAYGNEDSARAGNNKPVIVDIPNKTVRYGIATSLTVSATDADGDALNFLVQNKPGFATLTDNGNGTANLALNPLTSDAGVYNNIRIIVRDGFNGADTTIFNLTVNDNYDPLIDTIVDYTLREGDTVTVNLHGTDQNPADVLGWVVNDLPFSYTLTPGSNGNATLVMKPGYAAAGVYTPSVVINDGKGGTTTRTFRVTVTDKDPSIRIYSRILTLGAVGAPWNNITSTVTSNLKDENDNTTTVGLSMEPSWFATYYAGPQTGNNSGVYPDAVLRDYLYFGILGGPDTMYMSVTGLDPAKRHNLTFYAGSSWTGVPDNGSTTFTVGNQTVSLYVQNNSQNTVTLSNLQPDANGTILFKAAKAPGTPAGYFNALVISTPYDDGTAPVAPKALTGQYVFGEGVKLTWQDVSYNETAFEIYRATNAAGPFVLSGTANGANVTTFTDNTSAGSTQYYYKVRATNNYGASGYSNTFSIVTPNRIPQIAAIASVTLKNNETRTVNVSATDDATDHITLTAINLPSFASFTDNGNGTGVINIVPGLGSVGYYSDIVIKASDNADSSRSTSFDIAVLDKDVTVTYLNFSDGLNLGKKPWNNITQWPVAGAVTSNLLDEANVNTGMSITMVNGFEGLTNFGMHPNNGRSVYPESVMRTSMYESTTTARTIKMSGLSTSKRYNFVFFNSLDFAIDATTNFTINGTTVTLNGMYNINKTVQINGITPNASGEVTITVQKTGAASYAYLNTLVIESYANGLDLLSPTNLRVIETQNTSVKLQWADRAYGETGYQVWRATSSAGPFTQRATLGANVTTYTDVNLTPDRTYYYIVRAMKSSTPSSYTTTAVATTSAYNVYVSFNSDPLDNAPAPWNNTQATPVAGTSWSSFKADNNTPTSVGAEVTKTFSEVQPLGMNTGNNSGVFPDKVLKKTYFVFPGVTGGLKLTGLNMAMRYNLTVFGSTIQWGDANTAYTINGKTYYHNSSLNVGAGTLTIYGVEPDENGEIEITLVRENTNSPGGYLAGLILSGYNPPTGSAPASPAKVVEPEPEVVAQDMVRKPAEEVLTTIPAEVAVLEKEKPVDIKAFPNPFNSYFRITVPAEKNEQVQVSVYNLNGQLVYSNRFADLKTGNNTLHINANSNMAEPGIYMVRIQFASRQEFKVIKLVKQ